MAYFNWPMIKQHCNCGAPGAVHLIPWDCTAALQLYKQWLKIHFFVVSYHVTMMLSYVTMQRCTTWPLIAFLPGNEHCFINSQIDNIMSYCAKLHAILLPTETALMARLIIIIIYHEEYCIVLSLLTFSTTFQPFCTNWLTYSWRKASYLPHPNGWRRWVVKLTYLCVCELAQD